MLLFSVDFGPADEDDSDDADYVASDDCYSNEDDENEDCEKDSGSDDCDSGSGSGSFATDSECSGFSDGFTDPDEHYADHDS